MNTRRSLKGKVALVTDGSRNCGPAIVLRLASDGAIVLFTNTACTSFAQRLVAQVEGSGGRAIALETHRAAEFAEMQAIAAAIERFGRIDILVSNAEADESDSMISDSGRPAMPCRTDDFAAGVPVDTLLSHMPIGGRIIATAYAAPAGSTIGLARDLSARGITVNVVQPSLSVAQIGAELDSAAGVFEDVASLVAYLASDEAGFITGTALRADGGYVP